MESSQGHPMFQFPGSSDLVVCSSSPDHLARKINGNSEDCEKEASMNHKKVYIPRNFLEASFEIPTEPDAQDDVGKRPNLLTINCGELDKSFTVGDVDLQKDTFFVGGEIINTHEKIGEGEGSELYQSARYGEFSYKFPNLEPGNYLADIHLAEIVFTEGPPGMRTFDVIIQEEKVASSVDIYARVGANKPLVLSDLSCTVVDEQGLTINFVGVNGSPLVCGISLKHETVAGKKVQMAEGTKFQFGGSHDVKDGCNCCKKLKRDYDLLSDTRVEIERSLENAKRENELKSRECHEAWMSLQEVQAELMRKSMHVGSLAFAVEGQVKEKSRWFSAIRDLCEKLKFLKIEHAELKEGASKHRTELADMISQIASVQFSLKDHALLSRENEVIKQKFVKEAMLRRDLYNKVLELKGNIRVFCRCRPLNMEETSRGAATVIDFESAKEGELTVRCQGAPRRVFKFDSVFTPEDDQGSVFEVAAPLATSVLDGYNVCIFAYGQTGTGKTFTMEGTTEDRGVNYKTLEGLFKIIEERQSVFQYEISVSVLEVYNEHIRDLLISDSQPGGGTVKRLEVRQVTDGSHPIPGLVEASVSNMNEVWDVLQTGSNARAVGSTKANERSSRSHCIYCVMVKGRNLMNGECTKSKLWLVDLAGSERVAKTDVQGDRLKEAQNINKSLSALGDVISALATKSPHIPFRNSKLTHLLQDSLGGDSKALMFVQISPSESDVNETLCSLNFASRVRGIELGSAKRQFDGSEIFRYKQMLEKAKQDIKGKDIILKKMEDNVHSMDAKMKAKDMANKNLQDKVKELESQLLMERSLARQHAENTKLADNYLLQRQKQQQQSITATLNRRTSLLNRHLNDIPDDGQSEENSVAFREISNVEKLATVLPSSEKLPKNIWAMKENKPNMNDDEKLERLPGISNTARDPLMPRKLNKLSNYYGTVPLIPRRLNRLSVCPAAAGEATTVPKNVWAMKENKPNMNDASERLPGVSNTVRDPLLPRKLNGLSSYYGTVPSIPRRLNRLSMCPAATGEATTVLAPRRSSLIPFPPTSVKTNITTDTLAAFPSAALSVTTDRSNTIETGMQNRSVAQGSKQQRNILRKSLQKKKIIVLRPQQQQKLVKKVETWKR